MIPHLDRTAIAGMSFVVRLPKASARERSATDQYSYPPQECSIHVGDTLYTQDGEKFGDVASIDPLAGTVAINKVTAVTNFHPSYYLNTPSFQPTNRQTQFCGLRTGLSRTVLTCLANIELLAICS